MYIYIYVYVYIYIYIYTNPTPSTLHPTTAVSGTTLHFELAGLTKGTEYFASVRSNNAGADNGGYSAWYRPLSETETPSTLTNVDELTTLPKVDQPTTRRRLPKLKQENENHFRREETHGP